MTPAAKYTLLVVDDEPDVCDSIHDLFRRDFKVLKARSANDGYRLMQENEVHIVLTDQRMPQMSGVEMLARVRQGHPQAIRMLFTGYADLEAIIAAINQGHIYKFIRKPWQPEELQAAIREAAQEYDRLIRREEERTHLKSELHNLRERVTALENEVAQLRERGGN
jgi:response regulator RpfG family c-di-GMP phosphodiesterase